MLKARQTIALGARRQPTTVKDNASTSVTSLAADERAEGFESAARTATEIEEAVRSSLRSAQIELPEEAFARITSVVRDVSRHFGNMRDEAVKVGRRLLRLREEHAAVYAALFRIVDGRCAMPFSPATASRMCAVARFVDEGKVPQDRLPLAYSAAYEIVRLDDEGLLPEAERDGLVSPRTSRSAVLTWKRGRRLVPDDPQRVLLDEKARLLDRLARIEGELRRLEAMA